MSTTSSIVAGVLGVALGIGGTLLLGSSGSDSSTTKRRDGEGGLTPCQAAASIADSQWSKVTCGAGPACGILDQIQSLAQADAATGRIGSGLLMQLNDLLLKCATNTNPATLGGAEHCQKINAAKQAAMQHDWALCIQQLQHGH